MENSFKSLFLLFQKLDYRDKNNAGKKKLFGILFAYLVSNTALSFNFYSFFDEKSYIILTLTSNLFLIAMLVLNEFENLFLGYKNYNLLISLPVKTSTLFLAKFTSATVFLLLFISAVSIPQSVFFYLNENNIYETISFVITNIIFCYFSVSVLVINYALILNYFTKRAGLILNLIQMIFFVFIFYSTTLSSRFKGMPKAFIQKINILEIESVQYLPQTFFAESIFSFSRLAECLFITVSVLILLYFFISKIYSALIKKTGTLEKSSNRSKFNFKFTFLSTFINKFFLTDNYERASYHLTKNQIHNSRFSIAKYYPLAVMPVLFLLVGYFSDLPNLIFFNSSKPGGMSEISFFKTAILVLSPSLSFTLMMSSRMLVSNTKILDENSTDTKWIFETLPLKNITSVIRGADKYIFINFIIPVIIIIFVFLNFLTDMQTILLNLMYITSGIYFINSVGLLFDKTYPFTLESTKLNSASKFLEVIISLIFGVLLFLLQLFVFQNIIFVIVTIILFILLSYLINRN